MTTSIQQRPLPAGVVGLSQIARGPRSERREATPSGTLIIGRDIRVKGEIESCQSLIVEGRVEASLAAEALHVLNGGRFKGSAEVERADIAGTFEGTLTVRGRLSIKASGRVSGRVRYARINIEAGGEIAGEVAVDAEAGAEVEDTAAAKGHVA
ncbi:MAG: polymer-forming cytoskeletal protein [Proteobacteria bacterium]|nr:polymer-forming cytoskeletal protein [Pseudomonadota bacterium]